MYEQSISSVMIACLSLYCDKWVHLFLSSLQIMTEKDLFDQLFNTNPSPVKAKEDESKDLLAGLIAASAALAPKKKKKEQEVHELVRLAEKSSDKAKKSVQKWKEEQTMTPEQLRQKRNFEKITAQFEKAKHAPPPPMVPPPSNSSKTSSDKKIYMPNIINPFEKAEKPKPQKPKALAPQPPKKDERRDDLKKQRQREARQKEQRQQRERERIAKAKTEAKLQKIKRKEMQQAAEKQRAERAAAAIAAKAEKKRQLHERKEQKRVKKQGRKGSSSSSSSDEESGSGSSSSSSRSSEKMDWRAELRSITKYNPSDIKFKKLDREQIKQSGIDRIFGEDRFSSRWGKMEEQEDLRREMMMKQRKEKHHSGSHGHSGHSHKRH